MNVNPALVEFRGAVEKAPFFLHLFLAGLCGIGLSFIQAPYNLWYLIFPCFSVFYFIYALSHTKAQAFFLGFIFSLGYFVTGLNWIGNALLVEGNEYRWVWPLSVIGLPILLSLFTGIYTTLSHMLFKKDTLSGLIGFCALVAMAEFVRGYAFTGFPWNLYGYGWLPVMPVAQSVSVIGPYGLTFLSIIWGATIGYILLGKMDIRLLAGALVIFALVYGYGFVRLQNAGVKTVEGKAVHIVQPNIPQEEKWLPSMLPANFQKMVDLSVVPDSDKKTMIVWPETALPPIFQGNMAVSERVRALLDENTFLVGGALSVLRNENTNQTLYQNILFGWEWEDENGVGMYAKSHLVPFGEYIPFQRFIPIKPVARFSGFEKGGGPQTMGIYEYPFFTPLICYEIIFPNLAVNEHMDRPDFILTITNDAWYGDSPGPRQHFAQARFRAIEQGLPVIRSANTGISGIIDPYGRILRKTALMEEAFINADMPAPISKTIYGYGKDYIFILMIILSLCFSLEIQKRARGAYLR
jgi:apolipoprotein N-acyltransferase